MALKNTFYKGPALRTIDQERYHPQSIHRKKYSHKVHILHQINSLGYEEGLIVYVHCLLKDLEETS